MKRLGWLVLALSLIIMSGCATTKIISIEYQTPHSYKDTRGVGSVSLTTRVN